MSKYANRYVITGTVETGEYAGKKVWLYWSSEGGGWWQWGPEAWAFRFERPEGDRFSDAMQTATAQGWTKKSCGPWYYYPRINSVKAEAVPAIVTVS